MQNEIIIIQNSPRVEVVFREDDFEILKSGSILINPTNYSKVRRVNFVKGKIPWFTGMLTTIIDLITGHGVGHWKRGKGKFELKTEDYDYSIDLLKYDRDQTPLAIKMLNEKSS
ncbi:hypothetical protein M3P19_06625 [Muricauda sp. 2012CJ35-5]|uniref:Uncharacterized protein n=1 Tax=Flagellimonas spongiicola TaxID=2942208 RepID=A0ABT0PQW0_9FLAO|nr:hypothetical protein [Allomuricauda spongiicola]MCL6273676.1 hypothetical protein [Allomuricauda spongiicola]